MMMIIVNGLIADTSNTPTRNATQLRSLLMEMRESPAMQKMLQECSANPMVSGTISFPRFINRREGVVLIHLFVCAIFSA